MSQDSPLCVASGCSNPRPEIQFLCHNCVNRLRNQLGDIPALWQELETTLTRQDAIGTDGGRRSAETALAFKASASDARWVLRDTVQSWARLMAEHAGLDICITHPARWLLAHVQSIAMHPAADEIADEIGYAVRNAYHVINRPLDLLLAGRCDRCGVALYAHPDAVSVDCRDCDVSYEAAERHDAMADAASEHLVTAPMALLWARRLLGHVVPRGTWRSWVSRERILARSVDLNGEPLYVFADVRQLAEEWYAWQQKHKRKSA